MMEEDAPLPRRDVQKSEVHEFEDFIIDFDEIKFTCKLCNKTNSSCEHFKVKFCSDQDPEDCEDCLDDPKLLCGIRDYGDCLAVWRKKEKRCIKLRLESWESDYTRKILAIELDPVKIEGDKP
ncbi:MAG: hypothetical protein QXI54_08895 [Archaeoglobaceae archaeon]